MKAEIEATPDIRQTLAAYLLILRPKQWTKNFLLFAGLIFSHNLFNWRLDVRALLAFSDFCILSGAAYILNDIHDVDEDRKHPRKCGRPLASGLLSMGQAITMLIVILLLSFTLAWLLAPGFALIGLVYFVLVFAYSLWLKHVVVIDVFTVASGFVIRALAGVVVIGAKISPWLFVCTLFLSLFLALTKRRCELVALGERGAGHRKVLEHYSVNFLDQLITIVTAATIMAYSLYTFTAVQNEYFMATIPFVIYGIFRYLYLMHSKECGGSPEDVLLTDRPLQVSLLMWIILSVFLLYFSL